MSYGVVVSRQASEALRNVPFELAEYVWDQLDYLLADPVGRGQPAHYPRSGGQVYSFDCKAEGLDYLVSISYIFLDTEDENEIGVTRVTIAPGIER